MYLIPFIRSSRAITSCIIYPEHPIQAIAISEISSFIIPFLNYSPLSFIGFLVYIFDKDYTLNIIDFYKNKNLIYYQSEAISFSLFFLYFLFSISY